MGQSPFTGQDTTEAEFQACQSRDRAGCPAGIQVLEHSKSSRWSLEIGAGPLRLSGARMVDQVAGRGWVSRSIYVTTQIYPSRPLSLLGIQPDAHGGSRS